jgi:hypothetical protein
MNLTLLNIVFALFLAGGMRGSFQLPLAAPVPMTATSLAMGKLDNELVAGSRRAIIDTGISESYFDTHFRVASVFDRPGDQRVVWQLRVNGYLATLNDAIGFYTDAQGKRVYTHSIGTILGHTRDITRTISKARSAALMRSCIGRYTAAAVVLMNRSPGEVTSLYLTAHSIRRSTEREEREEREREANEQRTQQNPQVDQPEREGGDKRPPARIGYVNLETGKCSKGLAIVTP